MIKHIATVLLLGAALTLALSSCGGSPDVTEGMTATETTTAISSAETTTAPTVTGTVLVENGASPYTVISAQSASAEVTAVTRSFISRLETKTGVKLKLYPESYAESEYEIIVGVLNKREVSRAEAATVGYTGWSLTQNGNTFIITGYNEGGIRMGLDALMSRIKEVDGKWVVTGEVKEGGEIAMGKGHTIPVCAAANATTAGLYQCGEDSIEVCLRGIKADEYAAYGKTLTDAGYTKHTENTMGQCLFATYSGAEGKTVHLGYYPNLQNGTLRIVSEPTGYLPATEPAAYTHVADTTFTQIRLEAAEINSAPGMSYIMQLADGSFIIIDGGSANTKDEESLYEYLASRTPAGQKPVIAAWIITHAHSDHMGLANNFIYKYHSQIEIKMAAYNFPLYEAVQNAKDVAGNSSRYQPMIDSFIDHISEYWPNAKHFVYHAGQKLYLADAEIEFFFTHEDLFPGEYTWINHTSTAFRITVGDKSVMILGDCEKTLCTQMGSTFGDYLKSDMLQLSHHGFNGASLNLYQAIDPDICFWACPKVKFETDPRALGTQSGYDFNAYLRDESIKKREHYHNSVTTVIPMS